MQTGGIDIGGVELTVELTASENKEALVERLKT